MAFDAGREAPFEAPRIEDAMEEEHPAPDDRHVRMWNIRDNLGGLCVFLLSALRGRPWPAVRDSDLHLLS
jgi:hypothetical protein